MKDGWYTIGQYSLFVEDNRVRYGVVTARQNRTLYPFRLDSKSKVWIKERPTLAALRAGLKRETKALF